jgi:dissimilatory sulfite reductase (desulfoviridin) alpha/beta subunit
MIPENLDYDALKKRGFLRQKQEGLFLLRARKRHGNYEAKDLEELVRVSRDFGRGFVHLTTRQGVEIPFIKFEDIDKVEARIKAAGIETGTSGPRLRTTTTCPGNNWCKSGLMDTFSLYDRIENELNIKCAMDLPHKFKISISGCPNTCTRSQQSEIGVHGTAGGYSVYLGGCGGRTPRIGFKLNRTFSEDEALKIIEAVVRFFKNNAKPKQRLALLIEEIGRDNFLKEVGLEKISVVQ